MEFGKILKGVVGFPEVNTNGFHHIFIYNGPNMFSGSFFMFSASFSNILVIATWQSTGY